MAFEEAHRNGLFTVLWTYLRNPAFKKDGVDYDLSADLTGQANHLGVTIEADIIKQKQAENNGGYPRDRLRQDRPARLRQADDTAPRRPHPLAGRQLLRGPHRAHQLGRRVKGDSDLAQAVRTAVINKRAGARASSSAARRSSGR